ncbi:ABC-2 type transport system ATP-binding protein [Evansella caseinilytica]|uniref:ABC-2 type transport system ATP-binding protein n=1 Tax=Evansella caseinilytica TaxID=1503961 RepID=A0A1H3QTY0_9BACI|nr:ABC transporter ATP-binding protein [Evansella caseinilytica]SDZ16733.1 ABC-2 type transport system ATP-binding protein [Evansella caseinilytica]
MYVLDVSITNAGYQDSRDAVRNIRFHVGAGELVGLIGANGAGKSTTIKAILDMLPVMDGEVRFPSSKRRYAYIPEQPSFYEELTLWEHIEFAAAVCNMNRSVWKSRASVLLNDFKMEHVIHHLPASFSKGMQQKLMIIVALLTEPDVYIVDEPFIGLDPRATKQFLHYIQKEKARGAGILMSTHVLDTAEKYCDSFALIDDGEMIVNGTLDHIRKYTELPGAALMDCFDKLLG